MSKETKSAGAETTTQTANDSGLKQLQETANETAEKGFYGVETDVTPNENYTLAGVTKGLPTPETDAEQARAAREAAGMGLTAIEFNSKQK